MEATRKLFRVLKAFLSLWSAPVVALLLLIALAALGPLHHGSVFAQQAPLSGSTQSYVGGVRVAAWYAFGYGKIPGAFIVNGNTATGSQTITVCPAQIAMQDGRVVNMLGGQAGQGFVPMTVDPQNATVAETVTPTAVSLVSPPNGVNMNQTLRCANVTASFSNLHGSSQNDHQVISGDFGIQEAFNDASVNGGGMVYWEIDPGIVTLNTGGANTNLGSVNIPTRSIVMSATARVTTTIATCAGGWSLGYSTGTEFGAANTTLTAGTTTDSSTLTLPAIMTAAATLPIAHCTTSNASAGAIHAKIAGYKVVAPAS